MFDAITSFIAYLEESIRASTDPEEVSRLSYVLDKAKVIRDKVAIASTSVSISS